MSVKFATLDSEGIGIEMESDKPGWYDALNGLPGLFGSSTPEVFELRKMMIFFANLLKENNDVKIFVPIEVAKLFKGLGNLLKQKVSSFDFWDKATTLKEEYRKSIIMGIDGKEEQINIDSVIEFIDNAVKKINSGLKKAIDPKTNLYFTYFRYEAVKYQKNNEVNSKGLPCVKVSKFQRFPLPLFLESETHYMRMSDDKQEARQHFASIKKSGLYDKELKMFKVCSSLLDQSNEIGRSRVFLPGWLENESVCMHMEFKYLLGLLRAGLYEEFFSSIKTCFPCFLKPEVYGRSILENSSFISSSAFPDKRNWGRGFVARLSGSTAEFIDMWLTMSLGYKPFYVNDNKELALSLKPIINGEFFDKKGEFKTKLFSTTDLVYINKSKKSTYLPNMNIKKIELVWNDDSKETIENNIIVGKNAEKIRSRQAKQIIVTF